MVRKTTAGDVLDWLSRLFVHRGVSSHRRIDNGPGLTAQAACGLLSEIGVWTLIIEPGSPWEYGYVASLNGTPRDELLNSETIFRRRGHCSSAGGRTMTGSCPLTFALAPFVGTGHAYFAIAFRMI